MKIGTPNFNGARLKDARDSRGLRATALAEKLGVTRQAISQYEKGYQTPKPEVMARIGEILGLPIHFFLRDSYHVEENTIFFRSLASTTKMARVVARQKLKWLKETVEYLRTFFFFPEINIPPIQSDKNPFILTGEEIEKIAIHCRRHWGLGSGAITDTVLLLENNGVIVTRSELSYQTMDAFSEWSIYDNSPYVFLMSDKNSAARSRYDVAHELGHLVLHKLVKKTDFTLKNEFSKIEEQADRFAGAFLLPSETFPLDFRIPTLDVFRMLKEKWKTSIAMMIKRCENLGIIDENYARKLWISYYKRGWRKKEPLDDILAIEQPRFLRRCFETLVNEKIQNRNDITSHLPFAADDLEQLACLQRGYLSESKYEKEILPQLRTSSASFSLDKHGKASIIPLNDGRKLA